MQKTITTAIAAAALVTPAAAQAATPVKCGTWSDQLVYAAHITERGLKPKVEYADGGQIAIRESPCTQAKDAAESLSLEYAQGRRFQLAGWKMSYVAFEDGDGAQVTARKGSATVAFGLFAEYQGE